MTTGDLVTGVLVSVSVAVLAALVVRRNCHPTRWHCLIWAETD